MEKIIKERLSNNSIDKMLFLVGVYLLFMSLNTIKNKENSNKMMELISLICKM